MVGCAVEHSQEREGKNEKYRHTTTTIAAHSPIVKSVNKSTKRNREKLPAPPRIFVFLPRDPAQIAVCTIKATTTADRRQKLFILGCDINLEIERINCLSVAEGEKSREN